MAMIESQLDSTLSQMKTQESDVEDSSPRDGSVEESPVKKAVMEPNGDMYGLDKGQGVLPLSVDYRSPVSHFIPPVVEMYKRNKPELTDTDSNAAESSQSPTTGSPLKRKRGRPRVDKTSPEYLAKSVARKQAKMSERAVSNSNHSPDSGEKRKRGRPRVDKTSPEYLARKRAKEIEALERKAKKEYKRRTTADSAASSSAGDTTPRIKRKYTKRAPGSKNDGSPGGERIKGKRGRPRKTDQMGGMKTQQQGKIRVRSNLMPINAEPISVDSDDSAELASPGRASDSLSLDENLRALRHIHEKYANIDKDDLYEAHLLAANFKKPVQDQRGNRDDDDVLSIRSSEGRGSVKELDTRVEKLEDSSGSNSDSSSSGSGSSSSSSSSSSSGSSSSSDSSDSESEDAPVVSQPSLQDNDSRSFGAWSATSNAQSGSDSDEPDEPRELNEHGEPQRSDNDDISESDNESPDKSFQCHMCRKWYSTRVTLKIHRRVHQNRSSNVSRSRSRCNDRYECDCCNETFNRREKLYNHKATVHRGSMTVRCEVCRKCFEDETELAAHDSTHTDDERQGRCSQCGACFPRYDSLRRHRASHAAAAHACAACGKRFTHAHSLQRHQHNHARQLYRCVVCKASFARADQLAQHLNSHLANYKRLKP